MKFQMRINKFISSCEVCSRRNADNLIRNGKIEVNNQLITTPGLIIKENDIVKYNGKVLKLKNDKLYFLLNKPVNFISTCFDKKKRKTILDLINIKNKRIYPVGRLDRNTTGLIILTNDSGSTTFGASRASAKSGAISSSLKPAMPQPMRVTRKVSSGCWAAKATNSSV